MWSEPSVPRSEILLHEIITLLDGLIGDLGNLAAGKTIEHRSICMEVLISK